MVLRLEYKDDIWNVALPTVKAFHFTQDELRKYLHQGGKHPLVFDTNLVGGCNTNCIYCSTQGGKYDVRYPVERDHKFVTDEQYSQVISQLGKLGVKTFFICSNGEPLLKPERFLGLARKAKEEGVRVITYTNGTTLSERVLRDLEKADVSLVMKLESLDPTLNDAIILGDAEKRKKSFTGYDYIDFNGKIIPSHIPRAFDIYGDSSRLGIETMILTDNIEEVVEMRDWIFQSFDCAQFLKQVYSLGYAELSGREIQPAQDKRQEVEKRVRALDAKHGMKYPDFPTPDHFSFDARRLMNNVASAAGFPLRVFGHERAGMYQSSQLVKKKIGFGTDTLIGIIDENGEVNMADYFEKISLNLGVENVWSPK